MYYKNSPSKEAFVQNTAAAAKAIPREQAIAAQKPLFNVIDINGDGVIDKEEWSNYLSAVDVSQEDAEKSFT